MLYECVFPMFVCVLLRVCVSLTLYCPVPSPPPPVLLGVGDQLLTERSFRARLERRLALLLEEGLGERARRRWRRSTAVGNSSLQVTRRGARARTHTVLSGESCTRSHSRERRVVHALTHSWA